MDFGDLLYTDDTAVMTDSTKRTSKMLQVIEVHAVHDRLKLNRSKCEAIALEEDLANIRFDDGTGMAQPEAAKYPCGSIYAPGGMRRELGRRLGDAARTWQQLGMFC